MTLIDAFTILASVLALGGLAVVLGAQVVQNTWVRIEHELKGFKLLLAAGVVGLLAAIMHVATQVLG